MRVLITAARFFPYGFGGGEVYIASLSSALKSKGWDVRIATLGQIQQDISPYQVVKYDHENIHVNALCLYKDILSERERNTENSVHHVNFLKTVIEEFGPDIVHINGINLSSLIAAKELSIPAVLTVHHGGAVCPSGGLLRPDGTLCQYREDSTVCIPCCARSRLPKWYTGGIIGKFPRWVYSTTGEVFDSVKHVPFIFRVMRYPWLVEQNIVHHRKVFNLATNIIVPSQATKQLLLRNNVDESAIEVIHHGVTPFQRKVKSVPENRPIRFGFVGRYGYDKGLHVLFKAIEKITMQNTCELHIYGATQGIAEKKYFHDIIDDYKGIVKYYDHGFVDNAELQKAYENIDVVVVPSIQFETFGLVVNEALSAGCPVIVSRSGGMTELVEEKKYGFVVEHNNVDAIARALKYFIDNPSSVAVMSQNTPSVKTFPEYTAQMENVYLNIIHKDHPVREN